MKEHLDPLQQRFGGAFAAWLNPYRNELRHREDIDGIELRALGVV